ncbi:MAG: 2-oxoacid:acceptor oxidoreductase subunit alpha [Ignavibacteriales bacterium]|jgi:2-oxoglutarate ferredoxin oxidoreductase subunit alpha|nr:MAG: 2-oxoacid:acceptor oxidoreductase subunit alpha [Ignavibacterium sp.]MDX9712866.1 2-oxoacid:acceptor oxidoreductase subunit alpha [Ignavibacteriaceae bacterium]MEB2353771.1 2-oxoacid:acceptor oxidoreductase subunit alpha [Ignavibacteriales bacterium]GIK23318.1 MAG: 2-oxoglutarate ferredoxin oxidoreductase subunit alpha [Ignavibacteriota bacterium]HMN16146.1 2-oxoacid:acceptor oxidoreductase subunit alpha [Ignavibacteriaceae bacterium]
MTNEKELQIIEEVTVRFAGDSGDGMQLTGSQFSDTTAWVGNDLKTLPDYPAEIRAPAGTIYGVSGFQLHFSSENIHTPGDQPDVLVAMNPAALKKNLSELKKNGMIIVNSDAFDSKNLKLAHYDSNPLEDNTLEGITVFTVPITSLTENALKDTKLSVKEISRCKNFFALGLMYWLYNRPLENTEKWIEEKFAKSPEFIEANTKALHAGYNYGEMTEVFTTRYAVEPAKLPKGTYRNISGNEATALGFLTASVKSGLPLFLGSYPITPATEILQFLSTYKNFGVKTFQAEDEIAGIATAIGASFAGNLAITSTSGPGLALKTEAIGLAVMTELPLVIINVQRGGPSTGLPTKTEQSDLLQAVLGRNGESPVAVVAAKTPRDCFYMAIEASRIALKYMTPVILLTDGYLANGSEPWRIPKVESLPKIEVKLRTEKEGFYPYLRNEFLARPWAIPGTPDLEHRIGGLEKADITGNVSYDPENHNKMSRLRAEKIKNIENDIPLLEVDGDQSGDLLVLGWGGTYGSIKEAVIKARILGYKVSQAHLQYLNPFPKNTGDVLKSFKKVLVPEINLGQLARLLRSEYLIEVEQFNMMRGLPLRVSYILNKIKEIHGGSNGK